MPLSGGRGGVAAIAVGCARWASKFDLPLFFGVLGRHGNVLTEQAALAPMPTLDGPVTAVSVTPAHCLHVLETLNTDFNRCSRRSR